MTGRRGMDREVEGQTRGLRDRLLTDGWTDLAALQGLGGVGRGDGGVELALRLAEQCDHVTVGVEALPHHPVRVRGHVQLAAEVSALWRGEGGGAGGF